MILWWGKPDRAMPAGEWKDIQADSAPPGVYVPNMSQDDAERWKARLLGTRSGPPRVEIRKSTGGVQVLVVVTAGEVTVSMNGRAEFPDRVFDELSHAVAEARDRLALLA